MKLAPMRYKNYIFPHNPRIYGISYERKIAVGKVPFGRYTMKSMGMTYRVLSGEGEFVGEGAYDEFRKLATVFYDEKPGLLYHPVWQLSNAYFVSLTLEQEPKENYVRYSFEFWEDYDDYETAAIKLKTANNNADTNSVTASKTSPSKTHKVSAGETMWGIANRYGVALSALVAANPQIKNPNLIYVGDILNVPEEDE